MNVFLKLRPFLSLQARDRNFVALAFRPESFQVRSNRCRRTRRLTCCPASSPRPRRTGSTGTPKPCSTVSAIRPPIMRCMPRRTCCWSHRPARPGASGTPCSAAFSPGRALRPHRMRVRTLIAAACGLWKHRIFVYVGRNDRLPRPPGIGPALQAAAADTASSCAISMLMRRRALQPLSVARFGFCLDLHGYGVVTRRTVDAGRLANAPHCTPRC